MIEKNNNLWVIALAIGIIVGMAMIVGMFSFTENNPRKVVETKTEVIYDISDPFSEEKVLIYLNQLHVRYPKVALAQMKLESANGTSKIFREGNNLFGFKEAIKRPTTALGTRNNHAYYGHWRASIQDYAIWQAFVSNPENMDSENSWLNYIGHNYAEDGEYQQKLTVVFNSIKSK